MRFIYVIAILLFAHSAFSSNIENLLKPEAKKFAPGDIQIITSDRAPKPIGSYSAGTMVHFGDFAIIETAGQIGLNPEINFWQLLNSVNVTMEIVGVGFLYIPMLKAATDTGMPSISIISTKILT